MCLFGQDNVAAIAKTLGSGDGLEGSKINDRLGKKAGRDKALGKHLCQTLASALPILFIFDFFNDHRDLNTEYLRETREQTQLQALRLLVVEQWCLLLFR